jgi:autophagy-related protein 101
MAQTLMTTVMKIVTWVNAHKDHIPPILSSGETNPFPYAITVNHKETGWATRMGIYRE